MDTALLCRASTDRLSKIAKDLFLFAIAADQQTALDATNAKVRAEFARLAPTVKGDGLRDAAATDRDALRREATEMLHQAANASPAELEAIESLGARVAAQGETAQAHTCRARTATRQTTDHRFFGSSTPAVMARWGAAFVQRLRDHGWIEGRTVAIEYRWAEGRAERYAEIVEEFVRLNVNVIVTYGTPPSKAAMKRTHRLETWFGSHTATA